MRYEIIKNSKFSAAMNIVNWMISRAALIGYINKFSFKRIFCKKKVKQASIAKRRTRKGNKFTLNSSEYENSNKVMNKIEANSPASK